LTQTPLQQQQQQLLLVLFAWDASALLPPAAA
jgi:hypothetical protein